MRWVRGRRRWIGGAVIAAACAAAIIVLARSDPAPDNAALAAAFHSNQPAEVTVSAKVTHLLPDSTGVDGIHQRFDIDAGLGSDVEIDHNVTLAERVPVAVGDPVVIHGQFEPDPGHPIIHYTHRAVSHHEGGWIQLKGQTYQ